MVPGGRSEEILPSREPAPTPPPGRGEALCLHNRVGSTQEGGRKRAAPESGGNPGAAANCLSLGTAPCPLRASVFPPVKSLRSRRAFLLAWGGGGGHSQSWARCP